MSGELLPPRLLRRATPSATYIRCYAQRLASQLRIAESFDLGRASFGGMVALELARHLAPRRVFLFGS